MTPRVRPLFNTRKYYYVTSTVSMVNRLMKLLQPQFAPSAPTHRAFRPPCVFNRLRFAALELSAPLLTPVESLHTLFAGSNSFVSHTHVKTGGWG
jgi:hypothetical protein